MTRVLLSAALAFVAAIAVPASAAPPVVATPNSEPPSAEPPSAEPPIRVVSFNIRFENRTDAENAWGARRHRAIQHLLDSGADFIGLQEVLPSQRRELVEGLPAWGSIGRSREASSAEGESTPIFYDRRRWSLVDGRSGTFWLSETPSVPGSRDWKTASPRIATWAVLRETRSGRLVMVVNTHLDDRSQEARENGAKVIAKFLAREAERMPVIVMGDFNAGPLNPARSSLCEGWQGSPPLRDCYAIARAGNESAAGTYHGFKGGTGGLRIDAILASEHFDIVEASISHTPEGEKHLSDHYPVTASLRLKSTGDGESRSAPIAPEAPRDALGAAPPKEPSRPEPPKSPTPPSLPSRPTPPSSDPGR